MYAISPQLLTQEATSNGHFYVEIWLLSWPLVQEQWKFRIKCYIAPLQVLGTRLVQADSYPTWFENVAVVAVEMVVVVVGARRPSGLPASETFSCRPAPALSPAGRGRCHLHHTRMERGGRSSLTQEDRLIGTDFVYSFRRRHLRQADIFKDTHTQYTLSHRHKDKITQTVTFKEGRKRQNA